MNRQSNDSATAIVNTKHKCASLLVTMCVCLLGDVEAVRVHLKVYNVTYFLRAKLKTDHVCTHSVCKYNLCAVRDFQEVSKYCVKLRVIEKNAFRWAKQRVYILICMIVVSHYMHVYTCMYAQGTACHCASV
jgi:hypothetical protein